MAQNPSNSSSLEQLVLKGLIKVTYVLICGVYTRSQSARGSTVWSWIVDPVGNQLDDHQFAALKGSSIDRPNTIHKQLANGIKHLTKVSRSALFIDYATTLTVALSCRSWSHGAPHFIMVDWFVWPTVSELKSLKFSLTTSRCLEAYLAAPGFGRRLLGRPT